MTGSTKRGEIHLGDLCRALKSLKSRDDDEAIAIAACLGFGLQPAPKPSPPKEIYDRQRYPNRAPAPARQPAPRPLFVPPAPTPPPALPEHALTSWLQPLDAPVPAVPEDGDWLDDADELYSEADQTAVARQSLFPERTNRHILSASLGTLRSGGEIDVPQIIEAICRREVVPDLPRRPEPTLELGCQLLLDYSTTMVPYWEDLNGLIGQVADVIGVANTRVFSFDARPTQALRWTPQGEREAWRPDGRPVLAATDFGIQGRSGRANPDADWRKLTEECAAARLPLIILIPWPEDRWPLDIGGCPELVHWSPHTSAAMIKRKIGQGHRIG